MKFAIHKINSTNIKSGDADAIAEVIFPYKGQAIALRDILNVNENGYRAIIDLPLELFEGDFNALVKDMIELTKVSSNIGIRIPLPSREFLKQVPTSFMHFSYAAGTFQEAITQYNHGAREVYVTGSLAASKKELIELKNLMKIRMIPNVVQTNAYIFGNPGEVDPLKCFWVRPEGVHHYEDVVSVMEFAFTDEQQDRESAMLHFYNIGEYKSKLGLLITDSTKILNDVDGFYNATIDEWKTNCGLRCQSIGVCNACSRIPVQSKILTQAVEKNSGSVFLT